MTVLLARPTPFAPVTRTVGLKDAPSVTTLGMVDSTYVTAFTKIMERVCVL